MSTCSLPLTSRSVPEALNQTRAHQRITWSISGEVSLNPAMIMTLAAPTTVAAAPAAHVARVLTTTRAQRMAARLVLRSTALVPPTYPEGVDKDRLRAGAQESDAIAPDTAMAVVSALFAWLSGRLPGTVAAYLAMADEVDVEPLFDRLPGWRWVLPRLEPDGTLTWRDREVPREIHRFGMSQPVDQGPEIPRNQIDVFLVPGMAFDETGARLGRGGGYYDRELAVRRKDSEAVGVTVESRVIESVPVHDHDQRVEWLATENGVRECDPKRPAG